MKSKIPICPRVNRKLLIDMKFSRKWRVHLITFPEMVFCPLDPGK